LRIGIHSLAGPPFMLATTNLDTPALQYQEGTSPTVDDG